MPDTKTSNLPAATTPTGAEIVPVLQGGVNKKSTASELAAPAVAAHAAAADPHPQYLTQTEGDARYPSTSDSRLSDAREWSAATVSQADAEAGTATDRRAWTVQRVWQAAAAWWTQSAAATKLAGIAANATANATDAQLRDRSTHTGTQAANTITGLAAVATSGIYADLSGRPSLASVATSGAYADLSGRPTLGSAAQADTGTGSGNIPVLDAGGKVPSSLLPSYVDDVLEFANVAAFPATGETGKLYISLATNRQYRWSGSAYVEINPSPGSTDAVPEGSVNLYFTNARASAAAPVQSVAGRTGNVTLSVGDVSNAVATSDSRLSDARTPTAHNQAGSTITGAYTAAGLTMATARFLARWSAGSGAAEEGSFGAGLSLSAAGVLQMEQWLGFACSDESTAITTGTSKLRFRMPFACTLLAVVFEARTAPTGSAAVFDLNETGTSVFSTNPRIDAGGTDSSASGTPAVIGDSSIAAGAVMTVDFDQIGSTVAGAGIKMWLNVRRTA